MASTSFGVSGVSAASLVLLMEAAVQPCGLVHDHIWLGDEPLETKGCLHRIEFLSGRRKQTPQLLPRVHKAISLLKP